MERARRGYILLIAIGIISVLSLLVVRMSTRVIVFYRLNTVLMRREQAKLIALSGVQCVIAQLLLGQGDQHKDHVAQKKPQGFEARRSAAIRAVLKTINRWMSFSFTQENDGIDGSCMVYTSCDDGKLGQELFFDLYTMQPLKISQAAMINQKASALFSTAGRQIDFARTIDQLIKKKNRELLDITELLDDERMNFFSRQLFMSLKGTFSVSDLFSIDRKGFLLQPWALSQTVASLFGWKALSGLDDALHKNLDELFREPEESISLAKLFTVLYGEKRQAFINEISSVFHKRFEANLFTVISYGTYEDIVVKICVIIERQQRARSGKDERDQFFIKKIYWL